MVSKKIGKHFQTPFISSDRVCIRSCGLSGIAYTTPPPPPRLYYNVGLKMVGLANDFDVPEIGSPEFNDLADKFGRQVQSAMESSKVAGFEEVVVTEFSQ